LLLSGAHGTPHITRAAIETVEAGAQGSHKLARSYQPAADLVRTLILSITGFRQGESPDYFLIRRNGQRRLAAGYQFTWPIWRRFKNYNLGFIAGWPRVFL